MRIGSFLVVLGFLISQQSCVVPVGGCTAMGCLDSLKVRFEPPLVEEGSYLIEVELEEDGFQCPAALPRAEREVPCFSSSGDQTRDLRLEYSPEGELLGFWISMAPAEVKVGVSREGITLATQVVSPEYERFYPNGPECDGDYYCRDGTVVLHVR